jgi:uncharacterized protein involved in copper resistance
MGGGGFTVPSRIVASRPGSHVEVAEIDPAVTHAAMVGFELDAKGMDIHNMDARNRITTLIESGDTASPTTSSSATRLTTSRCPRTSPRSSTRGW